MDNDDESERERARHGIVAGRPVKRVKQERARALRMNMTAEEALLWERLRARRLDGLHWRRQQVIAGFIVDFYCHATGSLLNWMARSTWVKRNTTMTVMTSWPGAACSSSALPMTISTPISTT